MTVIVDDVYLWSLIAQYLLFGVLALLGLRMVRAYERSLVRSPDSRASADFERLEGAVNGLEARVMEVEESAHLATQILLARAEAGPRFAGASGRGRRASPRPGP